MTLFIESGKIPIKRIQKKLYICKKEEMERVVHKSNSFAEAQLWDIRQHINMKPEERQKVAEELKARIFGKSPPDVRDCLNKK